MSTMKKKPELLKKTGKSSQTLRKFLNNLKENDLHYENKQITQCVFLGVLRLKPVPSIFSNNVPSVSTTVEPNKSKRIKNNNSNKELTKNVSKKNNINKVLSGKVGKKNPEKIKAAVKKVPIKKPNIKIKLNAKKQINEVEPSTSNGKQETVSSSTSSTVSPDSIIARSTITLNPIISPTKFNPVQNLFDKLKQRREESHNEAGPSKIAALSSKPKEVFKSTAIKYKVCKINANEHNTPNSCKKLKKSLYKKSHERLSLPIISTSPITVSDTESTGKRDSDIILLDENNSINSDSSDNGIVEDIIVINDDSGPKFAERTLNEEISRQEIIDKRIHLSNSTSTLVNVNSEQLGTTQCQDVIIISDEPKQTDKSEDNNITRTERNEDIDNISSKSDVIVIDEVREIRVSPRLKKMEEKVKEITKNTEKPIVGEIVVVPDEKKIPNRPENICQDSVDISKPQELNIAIENRQNENKTQKTSPRLLKIVNPNKEISKTVKKELIEEVVIVNEKPKRRKNTMRSPTLPPMLLNAPMLLRSELAPKKPNYVNEKPRARKPRNRIKDTSNSKPVMPVIEQTKNISRDESTKLLTKGLNALQSEKEVSRLNQKYSDRGTAHSTVSTISGCQSTKSLSDDIIYIDGAKNKSTNDGGVIKKSCITKHKNVNNVEIETVQEPSCPQTTQNKSSKVSRPKLSDNENIKGDIIIVNDEEVVMKSELKTKPKQSRRQKINIFNKVPETKVSAQKAKDIVIVTENYSKENMSSRLLRSDLSKQNNVTETKDMDSSIATETKDMNSSIATETKEVNLPFAEKIESKINEFINLTDEPELNKHVSPRTRRSNFIKTGLTDPNSSTENTIVIKDEEPLAQNDEILRKLPETDKSQQRLIQKTKQINLDEIIIVKDRREKKQREKYGGRLLRSELSQLTAKKKLPVKTELEEVVVLIHDEPKEKQNSTRLQSKSSSMSSNQMKSVVVASAEQNNQVEVQYPKQLISDRVRKVNSEVKSPKSRTSRTVKMEKKSLPNSAIEQLDIGNLDVNSQSISEQEENVIVVPEEQINQKEVQSPRSLRSDRVGKDNLEINSPKPRTSRMVKMENNSLPTPSINQQLEVDDLLIVSQGNSETMENVVAVSEEQRKQMEVRIPRLLRSDRVQKVHGEVTLPKPRTSGIVKMENSSLPDSSKDQQLNVDDLLVISHGNSEEMENVIVVPEEQRNEIEVQSPRSLRSDRVKKINSEVISKARIEKMENRSLPNLSGDQQLDVDDLLIVSQGNSEEMENLIVVLDEQKKEIEVQSPRSLRSDKARKVNTEVKSSKPRTSRIVKMENNSVSNSSVDQQLNVGDSLVISQRNFEQMENTIVVPEEQINQTEIRSPRSLRSDRTRNDNSEVTSPKPRTPRGMKMENHSLPNSSIDQQVDVIDLHEISQKNSEPTKNVIVVPEQENQLEVKSPRSLRSDKVRKVKSEVIVPKPRTLKIENSSSSNSTTDPVDVDDLHIITQKNFEQSLVDVSIIKAERRNPSHRLLRSEKTQKEGCENVNISDANIDSLICSPRLLRSEIYLQKNSQNLTKEQSLSPSATRKTRTPQKSPQPCELSNMFSQANPSKVVVIQNELLATQNFNKITVKEESGIQNTETQKQSESPVSKKSRKRLGKHSIIVASSRKVVVSKKKRKFHNRKSVPKTSMLLRSELAQLKNVANSIKTNEKKITRQKAKSKVDNVPLGNQLLENSDCTLEFQTKQKNKKSLKTRTAQSKDSTNISKSEKLAEIVDSKKNAIENTVSVQDLDSPSEVLASSDDHISKIQNICRNEIANEVPASEATIILGENNSKTTRKNTSSNSLHGDIVQREINVVTTENVASKKISPNRRKKNKRKRIMKSEEEQKPSEDTLNIHPVQHQDTREENERCDIISKKGDITVFDFDESEPEVVPLRLNSTPKKEKLKILTSKESIKSIPSEEIVTPQSKKQRVAEEPVTKAQAKVQLFAVFNENSTQKNSPDIPGSSDKEKAKTTSRKKTIPDQITQEQVPCPQNENVKKKRGRPKASPNKTNVPQLKQSPDKPNNNTSRTSTSPLKQTTITDMFNVMMKKEKSSVDSVFEPAAKEAPQEEKINNNVKPNMLPPSLDRKPLRNNEEEEEYEDDSDCESRMEWIPEEYAEYKFKYSAKKMMTYKPIHKCKICLLILPTYYKLSKHKEEHAKKQNPYNCKHCEQSFSNVEDLSAHLRVHKGKHPYTCKKCDVGFWSKKALDAHTPIHVLRKVKQPNKRFRCDVCAKEFSKLCDMERHTRVHTGEKPCICNICNKRFQQSHNLSKHLLTHLHVKPFHCEICNKQFGRNDVLNRHLLTHSVEKPIKCPLCSKGFIRQSQLNNHMKKNHLDAAKIGATVAEAK